VRRFNRNYVRTHFGGSLFAMTDPWYMLMLMDLLGRDYVVWDQRSAIEFVKPGRGTVTAQFRLSDATVAEIRARTASGDKYLPEFSLDITDEAGEVVARVRKTLYVRRKRATGVPVASTGSNGMASGNASGGTSGAASAVPASATSEPHLR
jgi:acyl-coenzyme A thioesterase PaaI-like protein